MELRAKNSAFAWVVLDLVHGSIPVRPALLGRADAVRIEAQRDAHALAVTIGLEVPAPMRGETESPPFHVEVTALLTFATLALGGSPLWWRGGAQRCLYQQSSKADRWHASSRLTEPGAHRFSEAASIWRGAKSRAGPTLGQGVVCRR